MSIVRKPINLRLIRTDGNTQARAEINENVVDEYANCMTDGDVFPDVLVFWDGNDYWLGDGFTRLAAAKLAQKASLMCEVRSGSRFDAVVFASSANAVHGQRRTNADKRNAVLNLMQEHEAEGWSDQRVSDTCVVTRQFVFDIRKPEVRAAREERAAERKKEKEGEKATKPDDHPGTEKGTVKVIKPAKTKPDLSTVDKSDERTEAEKADENAVRVLTDEVDRLTARLAVGLMEASAEEKTSAAELISDQARQLRALTAEKNALASQLGQYMNENAELKRTVVRMQKKLDQAKVHA